MPNKASGARSPRRGHSVKIQQQPDGSFSTVEVETEYKFAYELTLAARYFAEQAVVLAKKPDNRLLVRSNVFGAVILSYSSLEAAWKEVLKLYVHDERSALDECHRRVFEAIANENLRPAKERHVLQLFNMCLRVIGKPEFEVGKNPYQAANSVRSLRNMLVHPEPGRVVTYSEDESFDYSRQQDIVKDLRSQLKLKKDATFPEQILVKECASWAVKSTQEFLHEFANRSGIRFSFTTVPKT